MQIRYSIHPEHGKNLTTKELREKFLVQDMFIPGQLNLTYTHEDRLIIGGATPLETPLHLEAGEEIRAQYFLERRELGIINIGGPGTVTIDNTPCELGTRDGLYVGRGNEKVVFTSTDPENPAQFYLASAPAHKSYPVVPISIEQARPLHMVDRESLNKRTIYQFVHPDVCRSCQLLMGLTMLAPNNVWNTMPTHTHERRMEAYLYFDFAGPETRVLHLMGEPQETRHLIVADRQAVISPPWSIHSGVATGSYTFIWVMCGENQTFSDMDHIQMKELS
ncbi:MAG: 5-dehydro-4-deoxy-D-glucuronate isomerase [Spirochaetota bacterium]